MPFRISRIAYLDQQVAADLKKKVIAPNWPTFLRVFCWSLKQKRKNGYRAYILKLPQGKKSCIFRTVCGLFREHTWQFGGKKFRGAVPMPQPPPPWLRPCLEHKKVTVSNYNSPEKNFFPRILINDNFIHIS